MVDISLNNNRIRAWHRFPAGYVKGYAFEGTTLLSETDLYNKCSEALKSRQLHKLLYALNGHFSVILTEKKRTVLIADKLKTYPLFYFKKGEDYFITDTADTVLEQIPEVRLYPSSVEEYLGAGYLSGDKTLLTGCNIVRSATYVTLAYSRTFFQVKEEGASAISMREQINTHVRQYYSQKSLPVIKDTGSIAPRVNAILERVVGRMLQVAAGRTIVLPLSGGYDSRLIACLCKKYQVPHVICYSYGIKDSPESEVSRKVAEQLGFPWHYVEYTTEKWEKLLDGPIFETYMRYGGNLNTIPHIQDLLAIHELTVKKILPANAVVVPGHTGDVIGGSHLPPNINRNNIVDKLYDKYFVINTLKPDSKKNILHALDVALKSESFPENKEACYQAFQLWNIRNRQANFIVNSVRAYELMGLDWYLPLWDDEYEQFWNSIPYTLRVGSTLYNTYMFEEFFEPYKVGFHKNKAEIRRPGYIRLLRSVFSADSRYLLKRKLEQLHLYSFPKDLNALDTVGEILMKKDFRKENEYLLHSKPDSMSMKSLFYLSLLHK